MAQHLVTGGAGFIGSHLTDRLLTAGHEVVVLDNLDGGKRENVPDGAHLVVGSIADRALVDGLFARHAFDSVFHLAAFAAEGISHAVKAHNYEVNVLGSIHLINAALRTKVRYFSFASSVAVYGTGRVPMCEDDHPQPVDSYGNAKLAVERELAITAHLQNLPYTALRMHNVYGERQNMADPLRNAVAIFLNQIMRGEPITVYGDGSQRRSFTYVHDIAGCFLDAADNPRHWNRVINVGSQQPCTVLEMAHAARVAMGVPDHPIRHLDTRDEVHAAYTSSELARTLLGDWKDTPLADGLATTATWARTHGPVQPCSTLTLETDPDTQPEWYTTASSRAERS
ncbi:NAD(P)-dependent oxidoreductase [Streptomyces sp. NBC_00102]|uniref:NAD-dependent epimerase/dehydratase family protein n=1 Tax=Streptomyces sp. NBC_00102 TaxID=2975652 RepID=UPI002254EA68|nr:NAD-dependent epimerase/dehydratase family protein [Streptomyces sp. NBC_00102]MCX5397191.1 NAD-dependent epimerase/dehydratase family protein [Streptomyces sp. NBC_00102]